MEIRIIVIAHDRASLYAGIFAGGHFRATRCKYPKTEIRRFLWGGNSMFSPTADITEIFGHGLPLGFSDLLGTWLPDRISGDVILFMCYSKEFSDQLLARGARSVLSFDDELKFRPILLPFLLPYWDQLIDDIINEGTVVAHAKFMVRVSENPKTREMMANAESSISLSNLPKTFFL